MSRLLCPIRSLSWKPYGGQHLKHLDMPSPTAGTHAHEKPRALRSNEVLNLTRTKLLVDGDHSGRAG